MLFPEYRHAVDIDTGLFGNLAPIFFRGQYRNLNKPAFESPTFNILKSISPNVSCRHPVFGSQLDTIGGEGKLVIAAGTYFTDTMVEQVKKGNRNNITFKGHATFTNVNNMPIYDRIQFEVLQ
ncbi:hypothetical protein Pyn_01498 [Prunus yedoensis var. nudiflora]|uniref:Uncharacterized protein n=1 Tax=Prunus yedoensis var. nudiflora TaxID=2094558 RepID=A0A314XJ18_PRUYE|nr:hypothetical protein Pyn_01498 [Prunus yedoensis var. nudiflora]